MDKSIFETISKLGKPKPETERQKITRLTEDVMFQAKKKHKNQYVLDEIEKAAREITDRDGHFICSREGIGNKMFGFEDHENPIIGLHIGVMPSVNSSCLNIFTSKISNIIHENGDKDLIVDIIVSIIVTELKERFGKSKEYIFTGSVDNKNEGIVKKR
jgi:hypothetical protein